VSAPPIPFTFGPIAPSASPPLFVCSTPTLFLKSFAIVDLVLFFFSLFMDICHSLLLFSSADPSRGHAPLQQTPCLRTSCVFFAYSWSFRPPSCALGMFFSAPGPTRLFRRVYLSLSPGGVGNFLPPVRMRNSGGFFMEFRFSSG